MKSALAEIKNAPIFEMAVNEILAHTDEYDVAELILPAREKGLFQRCAFIISKMPIDFIAKHAVELMEWFQDLNWPGAALIQQRLILFSKTEMLAAIVNRMVRSLSILADDVWLNSIKGLEQNANLKTLLCKDVVDILEKLDNA